MGIKCRDCSKSEEYITNVARRAYCHARDGWIPMRKYDRVRKRCGKFEKFSSVTQAVTR